MLAFGMPTLIETNTLEACVALCRQLNLSFLELNMNLPAYQLHRMDPIRMRKIAEQAGVFYTIHLDENLNVSDFNPYIANAYRRTVTETIELAKNLHSPIINMHVAQGVYFTLPGKKVYLFDQYRDEYIKSMRDFRLLCEQAIGDSGIMIALENCDGFSSFQKQALDLLLSSPVFGLTFDIGHNHSCGGLDEPYIRKNREHLCHMHIHDAIGRQNHLPLGTGELDLFSYLRLAEEQSCRLVLETKTVAALKQSVDWLQSRGIMGSF